MNKRVQLELTRSQESRHAKKTKLLRGAMTIVGALVIFCTFVVKEQKRDDWKNAISVIRSAQSESDVREDIDFAVGEMQETKRRIDMMSNDISTRFPNGPTAEYEGVALLSEIDNMQLNNHAALANANSLFEELPEQSAETKDKIEALKKRYRILGKKREELRSRTVSETLSSAKRKWNAIITYSSDVHEEMLRQFEDGKTLSKDIRAQRQEIIQLAAAERSRSEIAYKKYDRLSIYLYTFGWLLSLAAKLGGGGSGSAETE